MDIEVNTVECNNLSAASFLANNDLNITSAAFYVDFTTNELLSVHALPCFWAFLFQKGSERKIETVNKFNVSGYGANTCVRMAFKAKQMGLDFSFGKVDPTKGVLSKTRKEKFVIR